MKRNVKVLLMVILLIVTNLAQSQVKYSLERNDPEGLPSFAANISFLTIGLYKPDYTFGFDVGADYTFNNIFMVGARYKKSYIENLASGWSGGIGVDMKKTSGMDFYGEFIFISNVKTAKEKIKLETRGNVDYVTHIQAAQIQQYSFRFGYSPNTNYIETDQDGFLFTGVRLPVNSIIDNLDNEPVDFYGRSMMTNNLLYFGVSKIIKTDIKVDFWGEYKKRDFRYRSQFYFDIMFAVKQELQNMNVDVKHYLDDNTNAIKSVNVSYDVFTPDANYEYDVNTNTLVSPFGLRLGYKIVSYRFFGLGYSAELGFRPGPGNMMGNFYFDLGLNLNLFAF